jgi:hypothetical protein
MSYSRGDGETSVNEVGEAMDREIERRLRSLEIAKAEGLYLEKVKRTDPRYKRIRDGHYVTNKGAIGRQIHFLVWYHGEIAGVISGGSCAYAVAVRDRFFWIDHRDRLRNIVNNTVFRMVNHEPNLATRVLALWQTEMTLRWEHQYGDTVVGFETFVVKTETRNGTLYAADNWVFVGETLGSQKLSHGIGHKGSTRGTTVPKLIFCKWNKGYPCTDEEEYYRDRCRAQRITYDLDDLLNRVVSGGGQQLK